MHRDRAAIGHHRLRQAERRLATRLRGVREHVQPRGDHRPELRVRQRVHRVLHPARADIRHQARARQEGALELVGIVEQGDLRDIAPPGNRSVARTITQLQHNWANRPGLQAASLRSRVPDAYAFRRRVRDATASRHGETSPNQGCTRRGAAHRQPQDRVVARAALSRPYRVRLRGVVRVVGGDAGHPLRLQARDRSRFLGRRRFACGGDVVPLSADAGGGAGAGDRDTLLVRVLAGRARRRRPADRGAGQSAGPGAALLRGEPPLPRSPRG